MKTSAVLVSMLFGSLAVAAPVDKRALAYKTEVVTETIVVWTTVYDDGAEVAQATTTPAGYFYEQPKASSVAAVPTSSQAPPAAQKPSSAAAPPAPQAPTPAPAPTPTPSPVEQPKPETSAYVAPVAAPVAAPAPASSAVYVAPAPAASSPAAQPASGGSTSSGSAQFKDVDITIYDNDKGGFGACGTKLVDTDMIVALAQPAWGASTYDRMTGAATNPWCGQKIKVEYEGRSVEATIMDMCPGCSGHDIDLSVAAWKALTGSDVKTRYKASWSKIN